MSIRCLLNAVRCSAAVNSTRVCFLRNLILPATDLDILKKLIHEAVG